jgi:ribonucleoside-diphosphate reductase alpha chain
MGYPFGSKEAIALDKEIFETIYFASLTASWELAKEKGAYASFWFGEGCPLSKGQFQFDMWDLTEEEQSTLLSGRWDWETLRKNIQKDGIRNSELVAPMPTASTSQILGKVYKNNTECIEPIKSNLYKRKTSSGEFMIFNKHLHQDIKALGLEVSRVREQVEIDGGSVKNVEGLPESKKALYKTVWEMDQRLLIEHCAARSPFVTQACSMNLYLEMVNPHSLIQMDFLSWSKGIKTQYYLHSRSATKAKQHLESKDTNTPQNNPKEGEFGVCRMEEGCLMCGS